MELKEYNLYGDKKVYQDELTVEQTQDLAGVFFSLQVNLPKTESGEIDKAAGFKMFVKQLTNKEVLRKILAVILTYNNGDALDGGDVLKLSKLKFSTLTRIVEDFFTLNPLVKEWLGSTGTGQAITLMKDLLSSSKNGQNLSSQNSSTSTSDQNQNQDPKQEIIPPMELVKEESNSSSDTEASSTLSVEETLETSEQQKD